MEWYWILVVIAGALLAAAGLVYLLFKQYKTVGPNEVLIISGRGRTIARPDGTAERIGYRWVVGGGAFVLPIKERAQTLAVEVINVRIKTPEVYTNNGVPILAEAVAQVRIDSSDHSIRKAAEQFLGTGTEGVARVAQTIFEGKMREVMGSMTVEEIYQSRDEFNRGVREAVVNDFAGMGIAMLSFALTDISDTQGYLDALSRPRIAAAKRDAEVAQAEANRDAAIKAADARKEGEIAKLKADASIAGASWNNEALKAESQTAVNKKKAQADLSYELERNKLYQEVKAEEAKVKLLEKKEAVKLEEAEILRKEKELEAGVKKPAEARRYQVQQEAEAESFRIGTEAKGRTEAKRLEAQVEAERITALGEAEAQAMARKAASYAKYNQAALYEKTLEALPELARAVSEPLSRVERIVMIGGGDGLPGEKITGQVAKVLAQLPEVVEAVSGMDIKKILKDKLEPEK